MREAAIMLIVKDGLVLGVSRKHDPSKYGFCGGKVERGETPKNAAIRETYEETGIHVELCSEVYERIEESEIKNEDPYYTYSFYALHWDGKPKPMEGGSVKWFTAKELVNPKLTGNFSKYIADSLIALHRKYPDLYIKLD